MYNERLTRRGEHRLTNLYNNLDLNSPVRLVVYRGIVQIAAQHARLCKTVVL